MKKTVIKIILTILLIITTTINVLALTLPEGETYLYTYKYGTQQKVYHYGTGEPVTLPTKYLNVESEMRGVWVATVYNIAIGKQAGTSEKAINDYKNEFLTILNRMEEYGMNTLFFQVRPSNDAFYQSNLNSWSQFLVGAGIDPGWDPLSWMIEETHKRGFEFMCWMNAFRVTVSSVLNDSSKKASYYTNEQLVEFKNSAINNLADDNFAKQHPEYVVMGEADTRLILNPSEIAVQDFIVATLKEIVENYDIDGMHFDDYFYLNGDVSSDTSNTNFAGGNVYDSTYTGTKILNDLVNYHEYKNNDVKYAHLLRDLNLGEFRRENLNVMMRKIRAMVDKYNLDNNDDVEYGSKPAAIWRSNSQYCTESYGRCSPIGSNTASGAYSSYCDLYADTLQWVKEGLVDFVAPQVYYAFEDNIAAYADIVDWWVEQVGELNEQREAENLKPIKLYIAHGIYKYRDASDQFYNAAEISNQLKYNRKYQDVIKGSALYSYENLYVLTSQTHTQAMSILKNLWSNNATYPLAHGQNDAEGLKVTDYQVAHDLLDECYTITFDKQPASRVYGVYKVLKGQSLDTSDLSSRIIVKYDPYVAGEKETIRLYNYDENYDYYIKVVSTNGYISNESTLVDFSDVETYESIEINKVSNIDMQVGFNQIIKVNGFAKHIQNKPLEYKIWLIENGIDRSRLITSGKVEAEQFTFSYPTGLDEISNMAFKIEITDGDVSKFYTTNYFNIVQQPTVVSLKSYNNLNNKYNKYDNINLVINTLNNSTIDYQYQIYLCDELSDQKVLLKEETTNSTTITELLDLTQVSFQKAYLEIVLNTNNQINTYNTTSFEVADKKFVKEENITISKLTPNLFDEINLSFTIDKETSTNVLYKVFLVNNNKEVVEELFVGNTINNTITKAWTVEYYHDVEYMFLIVINNDGINSKTYSQKITINYPSHLVNNKINVSSTSGKKGDTINIDFMLNVYENDQVKYSVYLVDEKNEKIKTLKEGSSLSDVINTSFVMDNQNVKVLVEVEGNVKSSHYSDLITLQTNNTSCKNCNCHNNTSYLLSYIMLVSIIFILIRKKHN